MESAGKSPRRSLCARGQLAKGETSGMDFESHSSWFPCPLPPDGDTKFKIPALLVLTQPETSGAKKSNPSFAFLRASVAPWCKGPALAPAKTQLHRQNNHDQDQGDGVSGDDGRGAQRQTVDQPQNYASGKGQQHGGRKIVATPGAPRFEGLRSEGNGGERARGKAKRC